MCDLKYSSIRRYWQSLLLEKGLHIQYCGSCWVGDTGSRITRSRLNMDQGLLEYPFEYANSRYFNCWSLAYSAIVNCDSYTKGRITALTTKLSLNLLSWQKCWIWTWNIGAFKFSRAVTLCISLYYPYYFTKRNAPSSWIYRRNRIRTIATFLYLHVLSATNKLTHGPMGDLVAFGKGNSNTYYGLSSWAFLCELALRHQADTWTNVDPDICIHMAPLGHGELK